MRPRPAGARWWRRSWSSTWWRATPTPTSRSSRRSAAAGAAETSRQAYSIDAVNEFDPLFEDVYSYCEQMELNVDTLIHEIGAGQMEINFFHAHPLGLADEVFLFKRTVREAASAPRHVRHLHGQADRR
jgi:glutamine synthetase